VEVNLEEAVQRLLSGQLVVIPTDTVYGLAAALKHPAALAQIYAQKGRPAHKPLPVLGTLEQLLPLSLNAEWLPMAQANWPGPTTLVVPAALGLPAELVGPGRTVALRWPAGTLVNQLLALTGPLAVTSANRSGEAPAINAEQLEMMGWPYLAATEPLTGAPSRILACRPGGWETLR
jgi:L-threonylcarbamoyladenylate synthase